MKTHILCGLSIFCVFAAPKGKNIGESDYNGIEIGKEIQEVEVVPLSFSEVSLVCTLGIPLGKKLENVFNICSDENVIVDPLSRQGGKGKGKVGKGKVGKGKVGKGKTGKAGKGKAGKGKGKGKGGKGKGGKGKAGKGKAGKGKGSSTGCPSVNEVLEKLKTKAMKDTCVFKSLGWIDADGKPAKDVFEEEINSLPAVVASQMSQQELEMCAKSKLEEWSQRPRRQRCDATYSKAERAALNKYELTVAGMKCIKIIMNDSCRNFLSKPTAAETIPFPLNPGYPSGGASIGPVGGRPPVGINQELLPIPGRPPLGINQELLPIPVNPSVGINQELLPISGQPPVGINQELIPGLIQELLPILGRPPVGISQELLPISGQPPLGINEELINGIIQELLPILGRPPVGINQELLPVSGQPPQGINQELISGIIQELLPIYGQPPVGINQELIPIPISAEGGSSGDFLGPINPAIHGPFPMHPGYFTEGGSSGGFPGQINPSIQGPVPMYPGNFPPGGIRPPFPGGPGNFQQVVIEQPPPPPHQELLSQLFPERWPSNLVAAMFPADWLADNHPFTFGGSEDGADEYDYYDEYNEEYYDEYIEENYDDYTEYYNENGDGEYVEEYYSDYNGEDYYDYAEDDVDEETSNVDAVALPLNIAGKNETAADNDVKDVVNEVDAVSLPLDTTGEIEAANEERIDRAIDDHDA